MSVQTMTLTDTTLDRAMAVLEQEQQAILPSRWQRRVYYLFNFAQWSLSSSILILLVTSGFYLDEPNAPLAVLVLLWVVLILSLLIIPLFFLNLGLVGKLWRHARLRRELGIREGLRDSFKMARRQGRIRNWITRFMAIAGVLIVIIALVAVVFIHISFTLKDIYLDTEGGIPLLISFGIFVVGLSLFSLHFIRRGRERLNVVAQLQDSLRIPETATDDVTEVEISPDVYSQIAQIERSHIIQERQRSIGRGHSDDDGVTHLVQTSVMAQKAKASLEPGTRVRVQNQIVELMYDPRPEESRPEQDTGLIVLRVPGTSIDIKYLVKDDTGTIQVYFIETGKDDSPLPGKGQ
jgi:hypothetical protein